MGSYSVGRRFEYLVVDLLRKAGFKARRVPLSGRQPSEDIPNADIIVENEIFGKAKTTKAKKYVTFPAKEILELINGELDFLVFNFKKTQPFFIIRSDDFLEVIKKMKEKNDG